MSLVESKFLGAIKMRLNSSESIKIAHMRPLRCELFLPSQLHSNEKSGRNKMRDLLIKCYRRGQSLINEF
jgi:hypothetical protein